MPWVSQNTTVTLLNVIIFVARDFLNLCLNSIQVISEKSTITAMSYSYMSLF